MEVIEVVIPASGASRLLDRKTRILGTVKLFAPTTNIAAISYGDADRDVDRLLAGDPAQSFNHPNGIDLNLIWVRGTPGDKIRIGHFGEVGSPV